ncbi:hypothetical protein LguiA_000583 [Lonicera macranthoides]
MTVRNLVAWTLMINGYISCSDVVTARRFFDLAPERDIVLWNTMVTGYIECGDMIAARKLFDVMPNRDLMSWNIMLNGYANNADVDCAFKRMVDVPDVHPSEATLVMVLFACLKLRALDFGKMGTQSAVNVFKNMGRKYLISWNAIINGLAVHGHGAGALCFFNEMNNAGEKPDEITFLGILCACSHMDLVVDGLNYMDSIINEYSIQLQIEHYGCMVDLLARAGLLEHALSFINNISMKADSVIWTALHGACKTYKNVKLVELALQRLIELESESPANYVILSNIYMDAQRWDDVARSKVAMRDTS